MTKGIKVGDRIKFKSATRDSYRVATRVVRGLDSQGRPLVGYAGWRDFIVHWHEMIEVLEPR
jgi:hypothetical protein